MIATTEGIPRAAFARWEHRGGVHGFDRADWFAAVKQDRFARHYRIVAAGRIDEDSLRQIGSPTRRRCRFCDQSAPRATFAEPVPVFPAQLGQGGPVALDQCEGCVAHFSGGIDAALGRFLALDRRGLATIPVDAFKGLTKLALALMPVADLDDHEETIDWVANPDHDFDLNVFQGLACAAHLAPAEFPCAWAALARRESDEAWPSMLFFLGVGRTTYEISVPLGQRDDDLDVPLAAQPDLLPPCPFGLGFDPIAVQVLPIAPVGREKAFPLHSLALASS